MCSECSNLDILKEKAGIYWFLNQVESFSYYIAMMSECAACSGKIAKSNKNDVVYCVQCSRKYHSKCIDNRCQHCEDSALQSLSNEGTVEDISLRDIAAMLVTTNKTMQLLKDQISAVQETQKRNEESLGKSLNLCHEKIDDNMQLLLSQNKKLEAALAQVEELRKENLILKEQNKELKDRITEWEQYSRRNTVEIQGIPSTKNEDSTAIVMTVCKALNMTIKREDVDACHRIPTRNGSTPPIIGGRAGSQVTTVAQEKAHLETQLTEKDKKVTTLAQENEDLKTQLGKAKKITDMLSAGYEYFPGFGFYKYHSLATTWDEAVQICKVEGAHLGIVNSRDEAKLYSSIVDRHPLFEGETNRNYFFSGFKEVGNTRQFRTLTGALLSESGYSDWDNGEPNNSGEQCGSINHSAKLNDIPCSLQFAYICELEHP